MQDNFSWELRVYYEDTDAGGIVFYANYLKFFERARTEWLRAAGVSQQIMTQTHEVMFVVKGTAVEYHAPAKLDEEAWCGGNCLANGRIKVGCVGTVGLRPSAIPDEVLDKIR